MDRIIFLGCFYYKAAQVLEYYPDYIEFIGKHTKDTENFKNESIGLFLSANLYVLSCQLLLTSFIYILIIKNNFIIKECNLKRETIFKVQIWN